MAVKLKNYHFFFILFLLVGHCAICVAVEEDDEKTPNTTEIKGKVDEDASMVGRKLHHTKDRLDKKKTNEISWNPDSRNYQMRVAKARRRWKKTFEEIKKITAPEDQGSQQKIGSKFFDQWKLFLDGDTNSLNRFTVNGSNSTASQLDGASGADDSEVGETKATRRKRQRFDGFASWDKMLQQWADDADHFTVGSNKESSEGIGKALGELVDLDEEEKKKIRFTPRTAKEGEAIVPHTDIGDKSKNIWIVTTAALPWMTGTAVNPLLRAAVMTNGREEKGGKVTLMLPWLEREADRDKIYGKDRDFDTSEEQEECIRTWLREKAGLKKASEVLNIAWYIGRHETLENSIYSMGDITALIPVSISA